MVLPQFINLEDIVKKERRCGVRAWPKLMLPSYSVVHAQQYFLAWSLCVDLGPWKNARLTFNVSCEICWIAHLHAIIPDPLPVPCFQPDCAKLVLSWLISCLSDRAGIRSYFLLFSVILYDVARQCAASKAIRRIQPCH